MSTKVSTMSEQSQGPSGFIELGGEMFLVDYGRICAADGSQCGYLFEDGYLKGNFGPLTEKHGLVAIDDIEGCVFRGIDSSGMELDLPGVRVGPDGTLKYNGVVLTVINGRIATQDHRLVGEFDDDGEVYVRDREIKEPRRKLDEHTQLNSYFEGNRSDGSAWTHEFGRPLYRKNLSYSDNEIIRYFDDFDKLNTPQKQYVMESMRLWASCGILQIVRKSEGVAQFGNVRHGAAGVTGVRHGNVTLDKEEFEKEIMLYKRFGPLAVIAIRLQPYVEVRVNLVVSHEFGHQLEFVLSQASQTLITELYEKHKAKSGRYYPLPNGYEGYAEVLTPQQVHQRVFISGYARTSMHEYWAECVAAFSVKDSRKMLKELDPGAYAILRDVVTNPAKMIRPVFREQIMDLQTSLRIGGEYTEDLIAD